jgi:hypothetical protein
MIHCKSISGIIHERQQTYHEYVSLLIEVHGTNINFFFTVVPCDLVSFLNNPAKIMNN